MFSIEKDCTKNGGMESITSRQGGIKT